VSRLSTIFFFSFFWEGFVFSLLSGFCRGMDSHDDLFLASMPAATAHHHRLHHHSSVVGLVDRQQTIGAVCWSGGNDKNRETFFKAQMGLGEAAFIGIGIFLRMGHLLTVLFVCRGGIYSKRILALIFCLYFLFFLSVCGAVGCRHGTTVSRKPDRSLTPSPLRCRFPVAACVQLLH
jgi:hypothetical protein